MKIFLSYARKDQSKVIKLYRKLSEEGFQPWMDVEALLPGEKWQYSIINAIRESHFFLACLSRNSVDKRGFIQREIKEALEIWKEKLETDIYLVPVKLEDCEVPRELAEFQWVNLFESEGFDKLVKALNVGLERQGIVRQSHIPSNANLIICEACGYQIGLKERIIEILSPDDCRCPDCKRIQDWLGIYSQWLKYNERRGCYLIYAFNNSPVRKPPYTNYVTYEEDGILIQTGLNRFKVYGLILSEKAIKCTSLIFFNDGPQEKRPDLPIRGEYFGVVSLNKRDNNPYLDPDKKDYTVVLDVEGWDEKVTICYKSNEYEYEEALLLSWPNFKLKDWNIYYYLLESTPPMNKEGIGLRALSTNGYHQLLDSSRGQIENYFDAFEIVFKKKDGLIIQQSGIFNIHRNQIARGETKLTMAVNYGTSKSSVTFQLGDGPIEVMRFTDLTEEIIPNTVLSDEVIASSTWLPTYKIDNIQTLLKIYQLQLDFDSDDSILIHGKEIANSFYFVSSDLICSLPISSENLSRPISGFRICHANATRPQGEIIYEIKRMDMLGDPKGRYNYEQILSRYMEMLLILALATIVEKKKISEYLYIKAPFSNDFDNDKIKVYLQCLDIVLYNRIRKLTGFETQKVSYLNQLQAVGYSIRVEEKHIYRVVMDMDGDRTNISIFEKVKDQFEPIFLESLLYGANGYVCMLAENTELFPKPSEKLDNRLLWLFREIRLRSFEGFIRRYYRSNNQDKNSVLDLLFRFYQPIIYFIRLLFDALNEHCHNEKDHKQELIALYLAGEGWTLADAITSVDGYYTNGHKEVIRYLLEKVGFTQLIPAGIPVTDDFSSVWAGPKAVAGIGILKAPERALYKTIEDACKENEGIQSILGFDIKFSDGFNQFKEYKWHEKVPCTLENSTFKPVLANLNIPEEWSFIEYEKGKQVPYLEEICSKDIEQSEKPIMTRSVLARFIEKIYLKQLDRDRRI